MTFILLPVCGVNAIFLINVCTSSTDLPALNIHVLDFPKISVKLGFSASAGLSKLPFSTVTVKSVTLSAVFSIFACGYLNVVWLSASQIAVPKFKEYPLDAAFVTVYRSGASYKAFSSSAAFTVTVL